MIGNFYLGLIHGPVRNKWGEEVITSVTNLDIHDMARTSRTFDIKNFFIVTPVEAQIKLLNRVLGYWEKDQANIYNPYRFDALARVRVARSFDELVSKVTDLEGIKPFIVATGANFQGDNLLTPQALMNKINQNNRPLLLLFGTGYGLLESMLDQTDALLTSICGYAPDGYNHLSVRSAVAIYSELLRMECRVITYATNENNSKTANNK
ncbi:MAG: RNA methyltransferase [Oligoflexia bacterium]|nr:RNA methyltransferase [Oligoflexia bacterium]